MTVIRMSVRDIWIEETLAQIQRAVEDSPDEEERGRHLAEVADALVALQAKKPGVAEAIRTAVERAVASGVVTEEQGRSISAKLT